MLYKSLALLAGLTGASLLAAATAQAPDRRPTPPATPDLPAFDPAACADPARRASIIAQGDQIFARANADAVGLHNDGLAAWWNARLIRSGRWTEAERDAFVMRLPEEPDVRRSIEAFRAVTGDMARSAEQIAHGTADPVAECRAMVLFRDFEIRTIPLVEAHWRAIDAAYAAEARRLGVSLE